MAFLWQDEQGRPGLLSSQPLLFRSGMQWVRSRRRNATQRPGAAHKSKLQRKEDQARPRTASACNVYGWKLTNVVAARCTKAFISILHG